MSKNSRGRKPKVRKTWAINPETRIHDVRREYKRSRRDEELRQHFEEEEVEELENFDALEDVEDSELDALEEFIRDEEEEER